MSIHSFAVMAYGDSEHLANCIDSLLAQTEKSDIYITTSTPSAYIEKVSARYAIPVYINKCSKGISEDWSYSYSQCNTDYVTLAHQDDIYLSHYTRRSLEVAEKCSDNLITFTDYFQLQGSELFRWNINLAVKRFLLLPIIIKGSWNNSLIRRIMVTFGNPICCPSVMYHKRRIGEFRFSKEYSYNLDWDAWIRLAAIDGAFSYVNAPLICHRIHAGSQTSLQISSKHRREEELMCLKRLMPASWALFYGKLYKFGELCNRVKDTE